MVLLYLPATRLLDASGILAEVHKRVPAQCFAITSTATHDRVQRLGKLSFDCLPNIVSDFTRAATSYASIMHDYRYAPKSMSLQS